MTEQGYLDIIIWNVGHGSATSVRLPNGNVIMLDCGSDPATGFSPVQATLQLWRRIDVLSISHPHMDHIGDIRSIANHWPCLLAAPQVPSRQILEGKQAGDLDTAQYYIDFKSGYGPLAFDPSIIFGDVDVTSFCLRGPHSDMNAYSIVTFLQYGCFTFLYAGDLPSSHWPKLIDSPDGQFAGLLSATNFLEASHHGRDEGYSAEAMSLMADPRPAFVSDKEEQSTSVTGMYDYYFKGWHAYNRATQEREWRKVLTTRNDGCISLRVGPSTTGARPHVEVWFGVRHE